MRAGRIATGLDWIKVAAEHVRIFDERFVEAEIHRVNGELLVAGAGRRMPRPAFAAPWRSGTFSATTSETRRPAP